MQEGRGSLGRGKGWEERCGDKSPAWSSQDLGSTVHDHMAVKQNFTLVYFVHPKQQCTVETRNVMELAAHAEMDQLSTVDKAS